MHIQMSNPHTGESKFVKVGFSWVLFLFSWFFGMPLFFRGLNLHGDFVAAACVIGSIITSGPGGEALASLFGLILIGATFFYGFKGNELTYNHLVAQGWRRSDGYGVQPPLVPAQRSAQPAEASVPTDVAAPTAQDAADEKICPRCAETVKAAAVQCKHCGYDFAIQPAIAETAGYPVPPSSPNKVLKIVGIVAAVLVGLMIIGAFVDASKDSASEGQETVSNDSSGESSPPSPSALTVTAHELFAAYDANEQAAQLKYGSQPVEISGTIEAVELDMADEPMVSLAAGEMFQQVTLHFGSRDAAMTAQLRKGQRFSARCNRVMEIAGFPQLQDCTALQSPSPQAWRNETAPSAQIEQTSNAAVPLTASWMAGTWDVAGGCEGDGGETFSANHTWGRWAVEGRWSLQGNRLTVVEMMQVADTESGEPEAITPHKRITSEILNATADSFDQRKDGQTHRMVRC